VKKRREHSRNNYRPKKVESVLMPFLFEIDLEQTIFVIGGATYRLQGVQDDPAAEEVLQDCPPNSE
jgi:hypothetical protein